MASLIKVTLKRSLSKCTERQIATVHGLGLKRRGQTSIIKDTVPNRGMVMKVQHLLDVERLEGDDSLRTGTRYRLRQEAGAQS